MEPLKAKGVRYMQTVLTHYGGWHNGATGENGFLSHVCHSGDGESHTGWGERFEILSTPRSHEDVGVRHTCADSS